MKPLARWCPSTSTRGAQYGRSDWTTFPRLDAIFPTAASLDVVVQRDKRCLHRICAASSPSSREGRSVVRGRGGAWLTDELVKLLLDQRGIAGCEGQERTSHACAPCA